MFQSTHPRRVWLWKEGYERCWLRFQSTHPRRVWQESTSLSDSSNLFQSTHPRRVWLLSMLRFTYKDVSIHTPTQGVTMEYFLQYARYRFQSTHPRRVWLLSSSLKSATKNVSIHTPTQGVTHLRLPQRLIPMFQSTHPRRVWQKWNALLLKVRLFQSTHPRRVWHRGWHEQIPMLCFNPHTHAGCDRMEILENVLSIVSIHTPTQGVTVWTQPYTYRTFCFNPHTHAGCDGRFVKGHNYGFKFQSTHPRRVWRMEFLLSWGEEMFQSTHPRRVWHHVVNTSINNIVSFNPHTHAGCDSISNNIL